MCEIELKMRMIILGLINLTENYWSRKLTAHGLKFLEKSVQKLIEYSGIGLFFYSFVFLQAFSCMSENIVLLQ